ncbi:ABC transporter permease [Nocardioides sp.]|uniref:ABC transporter permease n=1 Tax=Nocardioides sp. TaxID=35761 RepID=UPI001A26CA07|nr:ABC transporter permease [Nocardioides sp.]MBJ7358899.1 ABC transporter permease [Nocardioides sp.]
MRPPWRPHGPTILGRARTDARLLLLTGLVIALVSAFTAAVGPLTERAADRAIAEAVRDAGDRSAVVATFPREDEDPRGQTRHPLAAVELRQDTDYARFTMPPELAAVVRPGVASLSTTSLQLLDAGPGRYLRLVYLDPPDGGPAVTYVAGGPPEGTVGPDQADVTVPAGAEPWPVQVAVSEAVAAALSLQPGDRLPSQDEQARPVDIRVSGVFAATSVADDAWRTTPELLTPVQGVTEGVERTSAAALVSEASLPDLRLAVPVDDLTQRVSFAPQPSRLGWGESAELARAVVSLKASAGLARGRVSWRSGLDSVLDDGRGDVAAARGQADVLLVGLNAGALLVLLLAAQLLAGRRAASVALARERGASLTGVGAELVVESLAVAAAGVTAGLLVTRTLVGEARWGWSVPVLVVASFAVPLLGAVSAARATDVRRSPANRGARRLAARSRRVQRYLLELAVLAVAALTLAALHQRGVTGGDDGGGDLVAASAATWWAVAGALVLVRALPPVVRFLLVRSRGSGRVRFFALAAMAQSGSRVLPQLLVVVAVSQLTLGLALVATEHRGQSAGALLAVGGDARLTSTPDRALLDTAAAVAAEPGVRVAVAGRVEDGVRASSRQSAATVRLVAVDAGAYEELLSSSPLPDAPDLARLRDRSGDRPGGDGVAALVLGGDPGLRDRMVVRWEDTTIPLDVVGVAPRVDGSPDPVVLVDATAFTAAGAAAADPDTVWAVGPGAASAVRAAAGPSATVTLYADELDARRDAPLASGLVTLAGAGSALLLLVAVLGVVLAAGVDRPSRTTALGRLRSLGLRDRDLWRVLVAELMTPVAISAVAGLVLGVGAAAATFGSLDLERVTGESGSPVLVLPWWPLPAAVVLCLAVLVVSGIESTRLRRASLAQLLRAGDGRA